MKTIVLFGATGTVGAYTATELIDHGYQVVAVGRRRSDNGFFASMGSKYYSVDVSCADHFSRLPQEGVAAILHFAGSMPSTMAGYDPQRYIDSIVTGTLNVLNYAVGASAERIIFTQTRADSSHLMGSTTPLPAEIERSFPRTGDHAIYTICKNAAVDLIQHYHQEHGLKRFILRLPTIYAYKPDPHFHVNGERRVMAYRQLIDRAMKGEKLEIWGDPTRQKEIVYVKDLTQIIRKCLEVDIVGGLYNVGRGVGVTLEEQIRGIIEVFSPKDRKSEVEYRPDEPDGRQFVHDISKTMRELGYWPQYDYLSLLKDFKHEMEIDRFGALWGAPDS